MAEVKTKQSDVVATFHRYMGRNPISDQDWDTVRYLTTKAPQEVESRLAESATGAKSTAEEARAESSTSNIDPLKIAQGLGYTEADFANDPGFASYWEGKSQAELEEALTSRADYDATLGRRRTPAEQASFAENKTWMDSLLSSGEIDQAQYNALTGIMETDDYTTGKRIMSEEEYANIAKEAETKARTELEPYYADLESRDMQDLQTGYADIRNEALRYQQQEEKSYKETLASTKQSLRSRGLTFSGASRATLGEEGALESKGVEGSLAQGRRYNWEDQRAGWQEQARDLGTSAERLYGSAKLSSQADFLQPEGLPDPYEGTQYVSGRTAPVYLPKKDVTQTGYVSPAQADIERQKELEAQKRAQYRLSTYA